MANKIRYVTREGLKGKEGFSWNPLPPGIRIPPPITLLTHPLIIIIIIITMVCTQVVEGIFKAYFEQKKSPADQDMLLDVAEAAGLSRQDAARVLSQGEVMDEVAHEAREAQKRGVHGVPHITIFRDDQESKARRELNGAQETETLVKVFRSLLDTTSTSPPSSSPEDGQTCEDKEGGDDICPM